ncbi:shikimate kinase [Aequorivita sublithincola DSM 14238]|uniref:Shikimate kinase n=1 Tax=Aequorivita sublithincola (strain DSM 14238 / LMG 21431 / ACAM 643 / 9-3) TaxID=746697 RepID=I3YS39_AEQSU|nr:shikimate kinase [Aequorivita sublithincola]AFL79807.1 shikimate kinase [Aequorivita sublithincola DSM 14238]
MKIVLIGYMGSGKSSVGNKLAEVLKIPFKDMDAEIEKNEGISISKIFSEKGEIYFRKVENRVLKKILTQSEAFVLATGGGTPCYGDSMDFILEQDDVVTVYLKTPLEVLTMRLFSEKENRPLLTHLKTEEDLNDFIRKHLFERGFYYNQSEMIIDVGSEKIVKTVEKILLKLF